MSSWFKVCQGFIFLAQQYPQTDWAPNKKVFGDTEACVTGFNPKLPLLIRLLATSGTGMSSPLYALVHPGATMEDYHGPS